MFTGSSSLKQANMAFCFMLSECAARATQSGLESRGWAIRALRFATGAPMGKPIALRRLVKLQVDASGKSPAPIDHPPKVF